MEDGDGRGRAYTSLSPMSPYSVEHADHVVDGRTAERTWLPLVHHIIRATKARATVSATIEHRIGRPLFTEEAHLRRGPRCAWCGGGTLRSVGCRARARREGRGRVNHVCPCSDVRPGGVGAGSADLLDSSRSRFQNSGRRRPGRPCVCAGRRAGGRRARAPRRRLR